MINITLNESGYQLQLDIDEYTLVCDQLEVFTPHDYGLEWDAVTWVSADYAANDPSWDVPEGWPDHLPLWEER